MLEESLVAHHLRAMMAPTPKWKGTSRDLLDDLGKTAGEKVVQSKQWPKNPRALSGALRRLAPSLRTIGIMVGFERVPHTRTRTITVEVLASENVRDFASPPSPPSPISAKPCKSEEKTGDANGDAKSAGDANASARDAKQKPLASPANPVKKGSGDGGDAGDAKKHPLSGASRKLLGHPYARDGKPRSDARVRFLLTGLKPSIPLRKPGNPGESFHALPTPNRKGALSHSAESQP